jgi:hypothetical protein
MLDNSLVWNPEIVYQCNEKIRGLQMYAEGCSGNFQILV